MNNSNNKNRLIFDGNTFYTPGQINKKIKYNSKSKRKSNFKKYSLETDKDDRARNQKGICK